MEINYSLRVKTAKQEFLYTSKSYYEIEKLIKHWIDFYNTYGPQFEINAEEITEK